jgi:Tfp pilus assembly protein PilV
MNKNGMTLVENLISMLLLTMVLTTGMSFFFNAGKMTALVTHKKMATEIVNNKMEDLRKLSYGSIVSSGPDSVAVGSMNGQRSVTVTEIDDPVDGTMDYKKAVVSFNWLEAEGKTTRTIQATTFIAP